MHLQMALVNSLHQIYHISCHVFFQVLNNLFPIYNPLMSLSFFFFLVLIAEEGVLVYRSCFQELINTYGTISVQPSDGTESHIDANGTNSKLLSD